MKIKRFYIGLAFVVASIISNGAYANQTRNVHMTFESGGIFSGDVTFADDYSSYHAVNGTLTGGTNNYNSAINWVWDTNNWSSGIDNFSNWLMNGTPSVYTQYIQLAYNYTNAPVLNFTSGVSHNGFDNYVNYIDPMISGNIAAIPEPETYGMMLMGLGLIGLVAVRRRKNQA